MSSWGWSRSPAAACLGLGVLLAGLALACGPTAAPPPTSSAPTSDPFAVVRATSQAAYQAGRAALDQGDLIRGCPAIDTAKTTDPDNRPDVQAALEQCLTQIPLLLAATAPPAATTAAGRPLIVATVPAPAAASSSGTPLPAPTQVSASRTPNPASAAARPTATAAAVAQRAPTAAAAPAGGMVTFRDPQGRFTMGAPVDWMRVDQPQSLFGTGVVEFRDPAARASLAAAVDTSAKAVSPELYAASIELAMQQQVPGYALEQIVPGTVSGNPAIRRVFTFTQHDASGQDHQARAFQTVVIKGQTPYILMGAAPAEQFAEFGTILDQMVESFRFS